MSKIPRVSLQDLLPPEALTTEEKPQGDTRILRWRLVLGGGEADGLACELDPYALAMDNALNLVYEAEAEAEGQRNGSLSATAPKIARWLEDIRSFFPKEVVEILQRDAIEKLDLHSLLFEPEIMDQLEADVELLSTLMALRQIIPERARSSARQVVAQVVSDLQQRLNVPMQQAIRGSLRRNVRNLRPRHQEMDWLRTIRANLKHYQADYKTIIPEKRIGFGRQQKALKEVTLCVDQSGSMGSSVTYACVFAAAIASLPALKTRLICFDTTVVDYSEQLHDPVELLFGVQLGGGTDIHQALSYCQKQIQNPGEHTLILISDLFEGGRSQAVLEKIQELQHIGVQIIVLLALNDQGAPVYNKQLAASLAELGLPVFACSAHQFPPLMAIALQGENIADWAAQEGIVTGQSSASNQGP